MKIKRCTLFITMVMVIGAPGVVIPAMADPQLTLQVRAGLQAGRVADGTVLAYGTIRDTETPGTVEFNVWSDAPAHGAAGKYTLHARDNTGYRLHVRLAGEGWQADEAQGRGIIQFTNDSPGTFRVEADGDQSVPSAQWRLQLQAVTRPSPSPQ